MRVKLILPISFLMLLAIPMLASSEEIQKMTVAELVNKCTTEDPNSAAFCNGLVNGELTVTSFKPTTSFLALQPSVRGPLVMSRREPLIYGARIKAGDLLGDPDMLRLKTGG